VTRPRTLLAIFWISVLGLYLELLLIRWVGTEIRIFAYLQNTVLVVCFLGLGIGLFTSERRENMQRGLFALLALAASVAVPQTRTVLRSVSELLTVLGEINIWGSALIDSAPTAIASLAVGLLVVFAVMLLVLEPFVQIGRRLGTLLQRHPAPLTAYTVNVAGSLAGIWLFVGLTRLSQPPATWFLVLVILWLPFVRVARKMDWTALGLLLPLVPLVVVSQRSPAALETIWSPYQKLELFGFGESGTPRLPTLRYEIKVNNVGYQILLDLSESGAARPTKPEVPGITLSAYDVPGLVHPNPERALVVGAGAGNDVAGLLRSGVGHITAVDIDPVTLTLGRRYHPEHPYSSERVETVTTDARSFFASTHEKYDVIAFGFLDAHTSTSLTNARLDHYVYTEESFRHVRSLLNEGGILTVAFDPLREFVIDRIGVQLRNVFGEEPLAFRFPTDAGGLRGVLFIAGDLETARSRIADMPELQRLRELRVQTPVELAYTTRPSSDDWPYLYLDHPRIPVLFVLLAGLLGLLILYAAKTLDLPRAISPATWDRESWHFFFLGAGFLLLEVQNISKASVVLGNTWLVNAVIITGVLAMVLLANVAVIRRPGIPLLPVYGLLIGTVIALYFVDLARFAFLPFAAKAWIIGTLTTLPMLFSGIAFARAFALAGRRDHALGANLLGALFGAVLEPLSFLLGIKALLIAVAILYGAAALSRPGRTARVTGPAAVDLPPVD